MRLLFFFLSIFSFSLASAQIQGTVTDQANTPLIAVNIYWQNQPSKGTITDEKGNYSIDINYSLSDTLVFSYTGYATQKVGADLLEKINVWNITLVEEQLTLHTFSITASRSIVEEFSVQKVNRLDIYKNPVAAADPLRAITALPASTNTDESANPNLRGSNSARTRVLINGVPINNPVRNTQINGIGNFSLFNTELLESQQVYAGNPPLIYGNASAGLVELNTRESLSSPFTSVAVSLANLGVFHAQPLKDESLLQVYGNHQFAKPFLALNQRSLEFLNNFESTDAGLYWKQNISERAQLKWVSYAIDEDYGATVQQLTYEGEAVGKKQRHFNALDFQYQLDRQLISLQHGNNFSRSDYTFGNIESTQREQQFYYAASHRYYFKPELSVQSGINYEYNTTHFDTQRPTFYFALEEEAPTTRGQADLSLHDLQYYSYAKWQAHPKWLFGAGIRSSLADDDFFSYQGSARYQFHPEHHVLLSGGKYHNYLIPNYLNQEFELLSSQQLSLEYTYESSQWNAQIALFQKQERGNVINYEQQSSQARLLKGVETYLQYRPHYAWTFSLANTYLDAQIETTEGNFRANNDLNYFLKASVQYDYLPVGNISLFYVQRPGTFFTPVTDAVWQPDVEAYQPIFASVRNGQQLGTYRSLNLAISKVFATDRNSWIIFLNLTNVLNQKNEQYITYSPDYKSTESQYLSQRILYFGGVWTLSPGE
ncbi:MAG: carboxypeptidase-like regulatory domain-containing protein [Bacteroidota bacterium]